MHYDNIFAKRKLHTIVVGVLDKRDLSLYTMQLLLQLPEISSHIPPKTETLSTMVLFFLYYKTKTI